MYRAEQLSHNCGSTGRAKSSYIKVNASAGLRLETAPGFLMPPSADLCSPQSLQRVWLLLVFPQLLESCHHIGSGYRL